MDIAALSEQTVSVHSHAAGAIHVIALAILLYCGFKALFHEDLKKILIFAFTGLSIDISTVLMLKTSLALTAFSFHFFNFMVLVGLMSLSGILLSKKIGSRKLSDMRGLGRAMPFTAIPLAAGVFGMMGLPPFSAFSSKVLIIYSLMDSGQIFSAMVLAAGEVLFFLVFLRLVRVIFLEKYKGEKLEESPRAKLTPLYVLLGFSLMGGLFPQISVQPFAVFAGIMGSAPVNLPDLSINWPLPALFLCFCGISIYWLGRRSNTLAGFLSAGSCLLAMAFIPFSDADLYGRVFAFLILFMGVLQFIYSINYMDHSHKQYRFYTFFLLMIAGLLGVSLSGELFSMFFFWEIMSGWCLWAALVHEEDSFSVQEASKYFVFNFAGAATLVVGMTLLLKETGSWNFTELAGGFIYTPGVAIAIAMLTLGFLMKAAQLPFRIDYQMHPKPAPTPISGYISSTMLKSGPFMMVKLFFVAAAGVSATGMFLSLELIQHVAAWIGAITIVMAASFAMLTNSMKRLLIFHTVSQLGYVVVGCAIMTSMGLAGGLLHFVSHMFFKNLLFLCAGAIFISTGTDRMDKLGGLAKKMPITFVCFMVGVLAIAGVPIYSGFVSKWMIYHASMDAGFIGVAILALFGSVLTLASFVKFMHSAYLGQLQPACKDAKEASWYMLTPMIILAGLTVIIGTFPGLVLGVINSIVISFNMEPLTIGLATITADGYSLNMMYLTFILFFAMFLVGVVYLVTKTKTRTTHVYVCGVGDLTREDKHVSSANLYEDAKKFIKGVVKVTKKIIGIKGGYVER